MAEIPQMNFDPVSTPWGRWAQNEIAELKRSAALRQQGEGNGNKMQNSSIKSLGEQITLLALANEELASQQLALSTAQASLQAQQTRINSLAPVTAASSTGGVLMDANTWTTNGALRPSITIYPSTGRVRVKLTAMVSNAIGTFSMPGYISRDTQIAGNNILGNLFSSGNSSSIGATHEWIIGGLATNVAYAITAEFYAQSGGGVAAYPSITAENIG